MNNTPTRGTTKVHPAHREILPDDPLEMRGFELPGDTELMLRLLVEEFARIGYDAEAILSLARDPGYTAFHGFWRMYGEELLRDRVREIIAHCGVVRVRKVESNCDSEQLVQLEMPS